MSQKQTSTHRGDLMNTYTYTVLQTTVSDDAFMAIIRTDGFNPCKEITPDNNITRQAAVERFTERQVAYGELNADLGPPLLFAE